MRTLMTYEERDLAEELARAWQIDPEVQVVVNFTDGYRGGILVWLSEDNRANHLAFPWRFVAEQLAGALSHDQRATVDGYRRIVGESAD